jgi:hypothetical protein
MKVGRASFGAAVVALSLSAAARAGEPGPPVDQPEQPEVDPYDDDQVPPAEVQPPVAPPVQPPPAAQAPAQDTGFGYAGMIAFSDDLQLAITQVSSDFQGQSTKRTQIQLRPALDFFVLPNFSIGGQLIIGYTSVDMGGHTASQTELGGLARVGYTFALGTNTSIWPRVAFGYLRPAAEGPVVPGNSQYNLSFEVYVPIVVQPVQHFFIGAGPIVSTQVVSKMNDLDAPKTTTIGVLSTLGGCFRAM